MAPHPKQPDAAASAHEAASVHEPASVHETASAHEDAAAARARRIVRVEGRVQGVGFRISTLMQAERLGIVGTVRNLTDGSVEADVEGSPEPLAQMVAWLREGPPSARVDSADAREAAPRGATAFRII
ncbi:acylphosphatase [Brachybacterium nesterenkovii]|uniref:acylphosphatase n=1 Tax=Brachybacterium nesterenkovii TaxID=47847 RepID=A0A1X6WZH9_9MICO|nr:acylphosphatase [Brachybacterium nesterenkovii]SLM91420.1 Acylphosphate phosphohydrolase, putative [Brachybacterium nesterenkovii]